MKKLLEGSESKIAGVLIAILPMVLLSGCGGVFSTDTESSPTPFMFEFEEKEEEENKPDVIRAELKEPVVDADFVVEKSGEFYTMLWEADVEEFRAEGNTRGIDSNEELIELFEEYFAELLSFVDYDDTMREQEKLPYIENLFEVIDGFYYMRNNGIDSLPVVFDTDFIEFDVELLDDDNNVNIVENSPAYASVYPLPAPIRYLNTIDTESIPMVRDDELKGHWDLAVDEYIESLTWEYIDNKWLVSDLPNNNPEHYVTPPVEDFGLESREDRPDCDVIHNGSGC